MEQTRIGHILDAQDYLGGWYLAIIVDEKNRERILHFLPYTNSKRDERFTEEDSNKIAPAFTFSELPQDADRDINTLRDYLS